MSGVRKAMRLACGAVCAVLLGAGAVACAAQEAGAAIPDEAALEAHIAALRPAVCARDEALCRHLKAFAGATPPCFPQGEGLSVGHAYLVAHDGSVMPAEYFSVRAQRVRDVTLIQSQHVYSENDEEKQAAEALVQGVKAGAVEPDNALLRYLDSRAGEVPQLLATLELRALVVRGEGPALFLRQAGKLLYAAVPDAQVRIAGQRDGHEGLLFAVLPAPASCQ